MRLQACAAAATCIWFTSTEAAAIRPFVTDDARVVGDKLAQLETWLQFDRFTLEHNALGAIGPTDWLELTLGVTQGGVHSGPDAGYSITGPVLQGKALLLPARDGSWPGAALALGILPPFGHGDFVPTGWGGFGYVAFTESLWDERLLLHLNVGLTLDTEDFSASNPDPSPTIVTAGFGAQAHIIAGLHGIAEVYYGDPYDPRADFPAMQTGLRYVFSDHVQVDGTFGSTLTELSNGTGPARTEQWGSLGVRLVTRELW